MGDNNNGRLNVNTSSFTVEDGWKLVTMFEDGERVLRALRAGAAVFLVKASDSDQIAKSIGDDHNSSTIKPAIELQAMKHFHLIRLSSGESECLSPREEEVLDLLTLGFLYREIGEKLDIGMETVRTYVKQICSKMHVRNRIEAVARYKANLTGLRLH
jgi:DNA-binding NarL/FixJ family response regulator